MPDKAIIEFQIAATLVPNNAQPHFNLGALYYRMGQMKNARSELITGLNIKPDDQRAQRLLSEVSIKLNMLHFVPSK